jgi:Lon protease-like protein
MLPLNIFEPRYLNMIDDAMAGERIIGMIQPRPTGRRSRPDLTAVGCAGRITSYAETSDGRYLITITGVSRFRITSELEAHTPYRQVRPDFTPYEDDLKLNLEEGSQAARTEVLAALKTYLEGRGLDIDWEQAGEAPVEALVNSLAMALPFGPAEKQALLEAQSLADRRAALVALLEMGAAHGGDDDSSPRMQ